MGVHGLWQLLHPAGHPVSLESLEGKVLAVDVSIWLHQTMKGMRDRDGNPLPNAHLQGLFSRICKLLFYRIKPVFVFDGGVPALKKQTMAARRERRAEAERESQEISQKLLQNLIKSQAVRQTLGEAGGSQRHVPGVKKGRNQPDKDMFELAPLPVSEEIGLALNSEEWDRDFELQKSWIQEGLAAVEDTHPDSEEFKSLPAEIQHEVLSELKEQKKYHSLSRINKMPEDSTDFSSYQLKKLMKQSRLTSRIDEVRKQMSSNTAGDITCTLGDEYQGDEVEARRIVSEDAAHYVLIKGLTKRRQQEEADRYELQSRVKLEKVDEEDDNCAAEKFDNEHSLMKDKPQPEHTNVNVRTAGIISSDSDSDLEAVYSNRLRRKRQKKSKSSRSGRKAENAGSAPHTRAQQIVSECEVVPSNRKPPASNGSCTSEDEGFIEVRIDPTAATEDDLFPASIFQTDLDSTCKDSTGAVSKQHSENVAAAGSHLIHTKNKVTELTSSGKLSAGAAEEDSYEELGDVAFREGQAHVPQQTPETDEATARRKNILNEILNQLEQKKKILKEAHLDDSEDVSIDISSNESLQVNPGCDVGESCVVKQSEGKDFTSQNIVVKQSEGKDFTSQNSVVKQTGGKDFTSHNFVVKQTGGKNFTSQNFVVKQTGGKDFTSHNNVASCSKAMSPETSSRIQESSGGFLTSAVDEADSVSESDEELRLAIELSLQTNQPGTADCSSLGSLDTNRSSDVMKHHGTEGSSGLLKLQEVCEKPQTRVSVDSDSETEDFVEVQSELIENPEMDTEGEASADSETDIQEDTDEDDSPDSDESSRAITERGEHEPDQAGSSADVDRLPVETSLNQLQPDDYVIDHEPLFQIMDQNNLEDARAQLESERSALMSERGRQARMAASITEQTNLEAQELLQLFGIPFIISPMEAEAQCAYLDLTNQTAGTITDDSDFWLFGGRRMYKNFFNQTKHVEFFSYDSIYNHFGISRAQLINIALLCGSDYTEGISGVGPVRALEIMAEFPGDGLEGLQSFRKWWNRAKSQTFNSENKVRARLKDLKVIPGFPSEAVVDAYLHPQVDDSTEKFTWGMPDLDLLRDFTKYRFGWSKEKTDQSLLPMMKQLSKKQSQGRIQMYFQPRHFDKTSKIQSERLKKALASMKNPRQVLQEDDQMQEDGDANCAENTKGGHKGPKKRKAAENREDNADSRSKHKVVRRKPAKQMNKKVKEKELTLVEEQAENTEEGETVVKTEPEDEVMKDDSESVNIEETEKDELNIGKKMIRPKPGKEMKGMDLKHRRNKTVFTDEQNVDGKREEKLVPGKQNQRQKKYNRLGANGGHGCRGGTVMGDRLTGGRGKLPVSLDEKQIPRGKHFRRAKPSKGRGVVNLSESSSSSDSESSGTSVSAVSKFDIAHAKQGGQRKNTPSSGKNKSRQEQTGQLETIQQKKVNPQVSKRGSAAVPSQQSVVDPTGSRSNQTLSAGKKTYQEFQNTDLLTEVPPVTSAEQFQHNRTSCNTDTVNEQIDVDISKADVSVINRQNLPSTLTYLNRRSREDQFLLHQLKGGRAVNVVEKRLEQDQKKSVSEKQAHVSTGQAEEQVISFEDLLGGLDVIASSVPSKGKKSVNKKQSAVDASQAKTLQTKIFQQIGQFGSVLTGASSHDNSETGSRKQADKQGHVLDLGNHPQDVVHVTDDDKQPLVENKHQVTNKNHSAGKTESADKETINYSSSGFVSSDMHKSSGQIKLSQQKEKTLKSSKSKAFDKPIGDCSSDDYDSDRDARKLSKKKKFLKHVEHFGDSKSVKGLGVMPRQNAEQAVRFRANTGIGIGKSQTNPAGVSGKPESRNASEDELMEYEFITADDLGSDFSELEEEA